jgi:hypothetical protein
MEPCQINLNYTYMGRKLTFDEHTYMPRLQSHAWGILPPACLFEKAVPYPKLSRKHWNQKRGGITAAMVYAHNEGMAVYCGMREKDVSIVLAHVYDQLKQTRARGVDDGLRGSFGMPSASIRQCQSRQARRRTYTHYVVVYSLTDIFARFTLTESIHAHLVINS